MGDGMQAERIVIRRVENGWTAEVLCGGSSLLLVAKTVDEVSGFVKGMEWSSPRPLYGEEKMLREEPRGGSAEGRAFRG